MSVLETKPSSRRTVGAGPVLVRARLSRRAVDRAAVDDAGPRTRRELTLPDDETHDSSTPWATTPWATELGPGRSALLLVATLLWVGTVAGAIGAMLLCAMLLRLV